VTGGSSAASSRAPVTSYLREFLSFLRHIDEQLPKQLEVHLILDNYATHKYPRVRAWLARRPRYYPHFTPTYSSWLNQVEI
jgi:putative transposase